MRYILDDGRPKLIKTVKINGMLISNPSDAMLDAEGIGYTYTPADPPEVTDETKKLVHDYVTSGRTIADLWQIVDKSKQELIDLYTAQIHEIYNTAEAYKTDGVITYPVTGKGYIPRWVYEFYNAMLISSTALFPTPESTQDIAAVDGSTDAMTQAEFMALYQYLITSYAGYTAAQNAQIKVLTDKIKELRAE